MKKTLAIILALTMVFALCACGTAAKPQTANEPESTDKPETTTKVQQTEPAQVEIQPATDEALGAYKETFEYDSKPDEYAQRLLVTVSADVKELNIFNLTGEEVGDVFAFSASTVESAPELTTGKPLVIWVSFPGTLPTRGFSFADANGETRYFAIEESGKDGSFFLSELVKADNGTLIYK